MPAACNTTSNKTWWLWPHLPALCCTRRLFQEAASPLPAEIQLLGALLLQMVHGDNQAQNAHYSCLPRVVGKAGGRMVAIRADARAKTTAFASSKSFRSTGHMNWSNSASLTQQQLVRIHVELRQPPS
jgi:hypothetical protein